MIVVQCFRGARVTLFGPWPIRRAGTREQMSVRRAAEHGRPFFGSLTSVARRSIFCCSLGTRHPRAHSFERSARGESKKGFCLRRVLHSADYMYYTHASPRLRLAVGSPQTTETAQTTLRNPRIDPGGIYRCWSTWLAYWHHPLLPLPVLALSWLIIEATKRRARLPSLPSRCAAS